MAVVKCSSPNELLLELQRLQGVPLSGYWLFRGQADASWGLVPSLFRKTLSKAQEERFEASLLDALRKQLEGRSTLPERLIADDNYLLALAQHYGCSTRLLDWTYSPLTAAYFAASESVRSGGKASLAVFSIARIVDQAGHAKDSPIVSPPSGANDNLAAQAGVFVKHDWVCRDYWKPEFNNPVKSGAEQVTDVIDSRFIRFELPAAKASELLDELWRRGANGISLFPGMRGFAEAAADSAWQRVLAVK